MGSSKVIKAMAFAKERGAPGLLAASATGKRKKVRSRGKGPKIICNHISTLLLYDIIMIYYSFNY